MCCFRWWWRHFRADRESANARTPESARQRVWSLARGDYGWLTPDWPIHRDFGIAGPLFRRARPGPKPWAGDRAYPARETPAFCKLSGLITEASPDWPVVDWADGYTRWRDATDVLLSGQDRDLILGGTAASFYNLSWP